MSPVCKGSVDVFHKLGWSPQVHRLALKVWGTTDQAGAENEGRRNIKNVIYDAESVNPSLGSYWMALEYHGLGSRLCGDLADFADPLRTSECHGRV